MPFQPTRHTLQRRTLIGQFEMKDSSPATQVARGIPQWSPSHVHSGCPGMLQGSATAAHPEKWVSIHFTTWLLSKVFRPTRTHIAWSSNIATLKLLAGCFHLLLKVAAFHLKLWFHKCAVSSRKALCSLLYNIKNYSSFEWSVCGICFPWAKQTIHQDWKRKLPPKPSSANCREWLIWCLVTECR